MKYHILAITTVLLLISLMASAQDERDRKEDKDAWKRERKEDKDTWKRERKEDKDDRRREGRSDKDDYKREGREDREAWQGEGRDRDDREEWRREGNEARGASNGLRFPRLPGRFPRNSPRQLANVPKGHYPPPGMCRLWFPSLPPGQQRPPQPCGELRRLSFGDGAFILYNEKAYDMDYDWRRREAGRRNTVPRDILDFYREQN